MAPSAIRHHLAVAYRLAPSTHRSLADLLKPSGIRLLYTAQPEQLARMTEEVAVVFVEPSSSDLGARLGIQQIHRQVPLHYLLLVTPRPVPSRLAIKLARDGVHDFIALTDDPITVAAKVDMAAARHEWTRRVGRAAVNQVHRDEGLRLTGLAKRLAHDLNNLHQVISVELELLSQNVAGPGIDDARTASNALGALIDKVAALGGEQDEALVLTDVGTRLDHFRRLMHGSVPASVVVHAQTKINGNVLVRSGDLDQLVLNLARNAGEAMPDGGTLSLLIDRVHVDDGPGEQPRTFVRITMADTGPGIPKHRRTTIFREGVTSSGEVGRGLGLSIVRGVLDRLDGRIFVSSELGIGTTFQLLIPEATEGQLTAGVGAGPLSAALLAHELGGPAPPPRIHETASSAGAPQEASDEVLRGDRPPAPPAPPWFPTRSPRGRDLGSA